MHSSQTPRSCNWYLKCTEKDTSPLWHSCQKIHDLNPIVGKCHPTAGHSAESLITALKVVKVLRDEAWGTLPHWIKLPRPVTMCDAPDWIREGQEKEKAGEGKLMKSNKTCSLINSIVPSLIFWLGGACTLYTTLKKTFL